MDPARGARNLTHLALIWFRLFRVGTPCILAPLRRTLMRTLMRTLAAYLSSIATV